jgi:hypothetical protein
VSEYDTDILAWSGRQDALLRRVRAGEQVSDPLDSDNVIEEVDSVGREQLRKVESLAVKAPVGMLKVQVWPNSLNVPHWGAEIRGYRRQLRRRYAPSMRQKIDLASLYDDALAEIPVTMHRPPPRPVPAECPTTLEALLSKDA